MHQSSDDLTSTDCEAVFEEELLDDSAPTRVSMDPRKELTRLRGGDFRPEHIRVGDLLAGKYRVERLHRRGALGLTLEALHTQLGQRVAVRLLAADPKGHPEAAARFLRGARSAVQYQNEHTARIVDVGSLGSGAPYIVTELLVGSDLRKVLRVRDTLPVPEAVDYILQACEGLADAHAHNFVHRNMKPTNLFLTRRDGQRRIAVLDFGVSEDPLSDIAINLGSTLGAVSALAYLASEQIRQPATVDSRADIWALGAMLYEMLTGSLLHDAQTTPELLAMIVADAPTPVSHLRPEISAELEAIVLRAVAKDREARFSTLAEFAEELKPFASEEGAESVERISKALGRRATSLPPAMPGAAARSRAIVHVARPPQPAAAPAAPAVAPAPRARNRWAELALTGAALAAAGAIGVFAAVHTMERALADAIAPRTVVADLSPALPAPTQTVAAAAAPVTAAVQAPAATVAVAPPAPAAQTTPAAAAPTPVVATTLAAPGMRPAVPARVTPVNVAPAAKPAPVERAVVADAKSVTSKPATASGLFDDAN